MSRWLFLPNSVLPNLELLAGLSAEQIDSLRGILDERPKPSRYVLYVKIAEALRVSDQDAASLYSFWDFARDEREEHRKTGADIVNEFVAFLESQSSRSNASGPAPSKTKGNKNALVDKLQANRFALAALFGELPSRDESDKIESLQSGPLPHMTDFRTFCDLRPVFDKTGNEIIDFVPSIMLRIRSHSNVNIYSEIFLQLTQDQVGTLESQIRRVRKKLKLLDDRLGVLMPKRKKPNKSKGA